MSPNLYEFLESVVMPDTLKDSASVLNGVAVSQIIAIAGANRFRLRWKSSCAGTLSFAYVGPDRDVNNSVAGTVYAQNNPADVSVSAATETKADIELLYGEPYLKVTFTPGADGTITYAHASFGY